MTTLGYILKQLVGTVLPVGTMVDNNGTTTTTGQYYLMVDKESITKDWILTQSPFPVVAALTTYLTFVLRLGPRFMANRKPYDLKITMRVYNMVQIIYNGYVLSQLFLTPGAIQYLVRHSCRLDDPDNIKNLRHTFLLYSWHYVILKVLDLIDTVFMVLRKKDTHITFLHLYHHTAMVFFTWYSNRFIKAQQATIPAVINLTVHSIMYTYYFLATFGPQMQRYLWWKKHLTKLQLGQFALVILYLWLLYYKSCDVSQAFNVIWIINVAVIAAFFINFYVQTYMIKPRQTTKACKNS